MVCPRQCALVHLEQVWEDNLFTAEGRLLHERVHAGGSEKRGDVRRVFDLPFRSLRLGVAGKADVVEFHRLPDGSWQPYPVEYKRGRRKTEDWDRVQLCAQALCLEEMLGVTVPEGALFYGKEQRREVIRIGVALREKTEKVAEAVHRLVAQGLTPLPQYAPKCVNCSLLEVCLPRTVSGGRSDQVSWYLRKAIEEL